MSHYDKYSLHYMCILSAYETLEAIISHSSVDSETSIVNCSCLTVLAKLIYSEVGSENPICSAMAMLQSHWHSRRMAKLTHELLQAKEMRSICCNV